METSWDIYNRPQPTSVLEALEKKPLRLPDVTTDCPRCGALAGVEEFLSTTPAGTVRKRLIRCPNANSVSPFVIGAQPLAQERIDRLEEAVGELESDLRQKSCDESPPPILVEPAPAPVEEPPVPERMWFQCECPIAAVVCVEPGTCSACGGSITAQEMAERLEAIRHDQAFGKSDYEEVCELEAELDRALADHREQEADAAWRRQTDRLLESAGQLIQSLVERVHELDADANNLESRFEHVQGELSTQVSSAHHRLELLEARAYRSATVEGVAITQHQVDDLVEQLLRLPPKFRGELVQLVDAEALARDRRRELLDRYAYPQASES